MCDFCNRIGVQSDEIKGDWREAGNGEKSDMGADTHFSLICRWILSTCCWDSIFGHPANSESISQLKISSCAFPEQKMEDLTQDVLTHPTKCASHMIGLSISSCIYEPRDRVSAREPKRNAKGCIRWSIWYVRVQYMRMYEGMIRHTRNERREETRTPVAKKPELIKNVDNCISCCQCCPMKVLARPCVSASPVKTLPVMPVNAFLWRLIKGSWHYHSWTLTILFSFPLSP